MDKLTALLDRAKRAAAAAQTVAERQVRFDAERRAREAIAADYARRLAERAKFRRLLSDSDLDGERFRWYFTRIENSQDLHSLRRWIDGKIARGAA